MLMQEPRDRLSSRRLGFGGWLLVVGLVLAASPQPRAEAATPAFRQATANEITSGTVANRAFTSANVAGDLIVVQVTWSNTNSVTVSDTRGNTYAAATPRATWNSSWSSQTFYAKNIAAGTNTVTATFATAINSFGILQIHEYSGIDKAGPLDGARASAGSGTAMNSGTITTTNASDLLFGAGASIGNMGAIGTGFSQRLNTSGNKTMDRTVTSVGTYAATATHGGGSWVMTVAAFKADAGTDTAAPSVPGGLTANAVSSTQINVTWTASTDNVGVSGYQVERCQGAGCTTFAPVTTVTGTAFNDSGRTPSTLYRYRVRAQDAAGNTSGYSTVAQATTQAGTDTVPPSVPTGLAAQVVSSTQINLSWNPSTDNVGVTGYRVYRDGNLVNTVTVSPVQDSGLTPGTTYRYTLSAIDAAGNESAQTAAVVATTPATDTTPPTAAMTAPASGSTVAGTVTVSANATDNVAVADVDFLLDGVSIGVDATAPYSVQWNTTTTSNGPHSLSARARDTSGNFGVTSGVVTVTVSNSATPPLPVGLVAGWNFGESTGPSTADVTGNGNTATLVNGVQWTAGKYGSGVTLDGANDYLDVANSSTINLSGNAMAFSAWVKPGGGGGDQVLFAKLYNGTMVSPYYQYAVELRGGGVSPAFLIGTSTGLKEASMGSGLPVGQWSHLAVVFDGAKAVFYVNGNLISSPALVASMTARNTSFHLGADATPSQFLKGSLDDVRLYNRTLTQTEVQTDMNTALVAPTTDPNGPTVAITSPGANAQASGIVTVTADAADNTAVAGVQFFVDGFSLGTEDTTAPYGANWDTRAATNGAHTLTARARDDSGNVTVSAPVTVNVTNSDTFQNEVLATGLNLPTTMKFLPDGRLLVAELQGKIKVIPPPYTTPSGTLFGQVATANAGVQQGIFDLALDPSFATNHYYYLFYTAATGNGNFDRLSRLTANATNTGTIAGSETVLYQDPQGPNDEHHGGAIAFGNDGKIYFTVGEHFNAANAQNLTNPRGKVHRINMDGTVPTDNPFYDGAGPNWDSIWAYGLRNPYRAYFDAQSNRLFIGDVGGNDYTTAYEEVNVGARGANYGWPNCENGNCGNPAYTAPLYKYFHNGRDASVTGGFVYHGSSFPSGMQGNYFFGDYAQNWIRRIAFNADGSVNGVFNFEPMSDLVDGPYGDIVYLTEGPDGALYYLDLGYSDTTGTFGVSKVRRIRYQQSNQAPVVAAAANPTRGPVPLTVQFSSAGSSDPEGQPLSYLWDFGDGTTSTGANPAHVYTTAGMFTARLTVSDGVNSTFSTPLAITAGSAPTASISAPLDGSTFRAGDVISYSGDASDPEDGTLPASAFSWSVDFLHEGHVHPAQTATGVRGGSFTIPTTGHDFSGNTRYRITLTVTDSNGLQDTKSVIVLPQKVNLSFNTAPVGLTIYLDGIARQAPFTYDTLIGFTHAVEARNQSIGSTDYTFGSWSDGGSQTHTILVPAAAQSYTANYNAAQGPAGPVGAWSFDEGMGPTSADASGNNNLATLLNGVAWGAGMHGGGLSFDGVNDYLTVPNSPSLDVSGSKLTLSMWLNPSSTSTGDQVVVGKHWNTTMTSPYYQYGLELQNGGARPVFFVGTSSGLVGAAMTTSLAKGQWSHLAVVFNGSTVDFFVNGVLASTGNLSATITARGNPVRVGADASNAQFYKGLLDDLRIYNRALSAAEVQASTNIGV